MKVLNDVLYQDIYLNFFHIMKTIFFCMFQVAFAAVDCTVQTGVCSAHDVTGYPTFKYFNYGKNSQKYMGGRQVNYFVLFAEVCISRNQWYKNIIYGKIKNF